MTKIEITEGADPNGKPLWFVEVTDTVSNERLADFPCFTSDQAERIADALEKLLKTLSAQPSLDKLNTQGSV